MRWQKLGVVYKPDGSVPWMRTHAATPTPLDLGDGRLRVYVSLRDDSGVSRVGFVEVKADHPTEVIRVSSSPCLDIGLPGTFDDNGALCTSVLQLNDGSLLMYYVGFELCTQIRYRLLTGAALSRDGGETFERVKSTPILERSAGELYFRCGACVLRDNDRFRMWYIAGSEWITLGDKAMPVYELRYMESADGLQWPAEGETVLNLESDEHGFGRPWVVQEDGIFKLYYSIRSVSLRGYRLGYAESPDGRNWTRFDARMGLDVSDSGWDSQEIMYSAVIHGGTGCYAFYNGNDFGRTGFGVALREDPAN